MVDIILLVHFVNFDDGVNKCQSSNDLDIISVKFLQFQQCIMFLLTFFPTGLAINCINYTFSPCIFD